MARIHPVRPDVHFREMLRQIRMVGTLDHARIRSVLHSGIRADRHGPPRNLQEIRSRSRNHRALRVLSLRHVPGTRLQRSGKERFPNAGNCPGMNVRCRSDGRLSNARTGAANRFRSDIRAGRAGSAPCRNDPCRFRAGSRSGRRNAGRDGNGRQHRILRRNGSSDRHGSPNGRTRTTAEPHRRRSRQDRRLRSGIQASGRVARKRRIVPQTDFHRNPKTRKNRRSVSAVFPCGKIYFFNMFTNVSEGIETRPNCFIFFFPSFCFSRSLRLREMSPP